MHPIISLITKVVAPNSINHRLALAPTLSKLWQSKLWQAEGNKSKAISKCYVCSQFAMHPIISLITKVVAPGNNYIIHRLALA